jgi:hypothetical protein
MKSVRIVLIYPVVLLVAALFPAVATAGSNHRHQHGHAAIPVLLTSGLGSGFGSTIGPDGALYVTQPEAGTIARINLQTGTSSTYATGLPQRFPGVSVGGVTDVAFSGHTAYALVSVVGADLGGTATVGLYRLHRHGPPEVVADIGAWSIAHPPATPFFIPSGVQYALQTWHGGFLVTDGHHNRVLKVTKNGDISEVITFGNIVPTGLDTHRGRIYLAEAGPVPHNPVDGKVVTFKPGSAVATDVASGAPILTDVEVADSSRSNHHGSRNADNRGVQVYAISNGTYSGDPEGSPGLPDTGSLVNANHSGGFDVVAANLDRPTALELVRGKAYVVTYGGEVWAVSLGR